MQEYSLLKSKWRCHLDTYNVLGNLSCLIRWFFAAPFSRYCFIFVGHIYYVIIFLLSLSEANQTIVKESSQNITHLTV